MKIGVAYLRMSTDKQEYSIDSQLRLILDYAQHNNILINKKYIDEGISGRNAEKRPAFMQMINDSFNNKFDCVLIYDSSRFARNLEQAIVYKSELKRNGVELISITEPFVDDDTSLITDALFGAMNEMYSRKLSKNVKRGMEQKALRGEYLSCAPFGYDRIISGKPLQINKFESKIVKLIFNKYLNGQTTFSIAREMNSLGIKTKRGNKIDTRWINRVLNNNTYKGYIKFNINGKTIYRKADHDPIIEDSVFDNVQKLLNANLKVKKYKERPIEYKKHWLTGLLRCKYCNSVFVYAKGYNGRSDRFRCGGYSLGTCLHPSSITVKKIENIVINQLENIISNDNILYSLTLIPKNNIENVLIDKEILKINKALDRSKDAFLDGIDTLEEYKKIKTELSKKLKNLYEQKENNNNVDYNNFKKNVINTLEIIKSDKDTSEKIKIIKNIINKIIYDKDSNSLSIFFWN